MVGPDAINEVSTGRKVRHLAIFPCLHINKTLEFIIFGCEEVITVRCLEHLGAGKSVIGIV